MAYSVKILCNLPCFMHPRWQLRYVFRSREGAVADVWLEIATLAGSEWCNSMCTLSSILKISYSEGGGAMLRPRCWKRAQRWLLIMQVGGSAKKNSD